MTYQRTESEKELRNTPARSIFSGAVLLVEDNHPVLLVAIKMLEILGFEVIEASNGLEALELYQKNAEDITLVVMDLVMPVMDGYTLFSELKQLDPGLPIIIASGRPEMEVTSRIARDDMAGFIGKPYSLAQLREVLKGVAKTERL